MTDYDSEDWASTLDAVGRPLGRSSVKNTKTPLETIEDQQKFVQQRNLADTAVAMGAVDTGEDFDGAGWLADWGSNVFSGAQKALTAFTGIDMSQTPIEVWKDITAGFIPAVQGTINALVQGFTGLFGYDWDASDAQSAAEAIAQQQADTAAAVAILQQLNSGNAQGGNSGFVDFTNMPDASSMGSSFSQWYSGAGTDTLGIVSGRAQLTPGTWDAGRKAYYTYTDKTTITDLQRVSVVLSTVPGKRTFGPFGNLHSYAYNYIRARVAESGTYADVDCVMVIFDIDSFDLGFVANGVWTKWITVSHKFRAGAIYSLDAGTIGGSRQYKILLNGSPVYTHNEVGTLSNLGAGYRKTGGGEEWVIGSDGAGGRFNTTPGALVAFYMADNTPPAMLSSLGRAFRSSSTPISMPSASNWNLFPSGFFDTFDYATNDLVWNGPAGTWTVKRKGNYLVSSEIVTQTTDMSGYPGLYKNGVQTAAGTSGVSGLVVAALPLEPNDVLSLQYFPVTTGVKVMGVTSGAYTYFQVMRITPDTVEDISS
ncbi:Gp31 [Mycolicibacterium canariasense]|uniref:Gp31 n=1 Tax=Mycolicibacterium canariasense TaxID=228230 RepID=A0A100WC78_MYCCR|nr:hypothetical protein [Mycolicibacterium canariasense]MCV7212672.1 hypothetical protein [Mycolicibacterium canariasense]ORV02493.1 hypothetical protein AWB94_00710 [Mycolicibacterium canariasense]GAS95455.1 Gp31 [Mycolicibacterium canariasense]